MRIMMATVMTILLLLTAAACSLPGLGDNASTQAGSTLQEDDLQGGALQQEESAEKALNTGETAGSNELAQQDEQASGGKLARVVLYFASEDGSALKQEERDVKVVDGAILRACMNALIEGPVSEDLAKTIPNGTVLRGISIRDKVATVDLSKEFADVEGTEGSVARWSVVNTLTRFGGVEKVRFHIDGEEMTDADGIPLGDLSPVLLNADGSLTSK